ncbi:wings apart-like protein regulation of heterochromatin-domain-containing protein [Aspergillus floccosus]
MRERTKKLVTYGKGSSNKSQKGTDRPTGSTTSHTSLALESSRTTGSLPPSHILRRPERMPGIRGSGSLSISRAVTKDWPELQEDALEDHTHSRIKRRKITTFGQSSQAPASDAYGGRHPGLSPYEDTEHSSVDSFLNSAKASGTSETRDTSKPSQGQQGGSSESKPDLASSASSACASHSRKLSRTLTRESPPPPPAAPNESPGISPDSHRYQNVTPTRRRLVDHLAVTEDRPSGKISGLMGRRIQNDDVQPERASPSSSQQQSDDTDSRLRARPYRNGSPDLDNSPESSSQPRPNLRGSKVTYARQRSFLDEMSLLEEDELSHTSPHGKKSSFMIAPTPTIPSYPHIDELNDNRPVRSIHELRQSGDNARFREAVELIFEDIEDSDISTLERCSSFIQLCEKLLDRRCVSNFSEYGFDERLVKSMRKDLDVQSASLALCAYRMACDGGSFSYALSGPFWSQLLDLAPALLDVDVDLLSLLKQRSLGLSRSMQASAKKILPNLTSALSRDSALSDEVSPQSLTLFSIHHVLQRVREKGSTVELLSASLLHKLVRLLRLEDLDEPCSLSPHRSQRYVLVLSILETYTIVSGPLDTGQCASFYPLGQLYTLLTTKRNTLDYEILILYVRLILNLTNKDLSLCDIFTTPQILSGLVHIITVGFSEEPGGPIDKESSSFNTVILALGALINLAEKNDSFRAMFLIPSTGSTPFLESLIQRFSTNIGHVDQAHSIPEMHHNVALGYLAILLVTICLNSNAFGLAKDVVGKKGISLMLSTSQEFLQYYQRVEQDSYPLEGRDVKESQFTARLEHIISEVRQRAGSV